MRLKIRAKFCLGYIRLIATRFKHIWWVTRISMIVFQIWCMKIIEINLSVPDGKSIIFLRVRETRTFFRVLCYFFANLRLLFFWYIVEIVRYRCALIGKVHESGQHRDNRRDLLLSMEFFVLRHVRLILDSDATVHGGH